MVGQTLGSYRIVAELGSGGMGAVYLAEHQRIERRAAIKVLYPELIESKDIVRRFFNEARATSRIHHPGIVEVFDCDIDGAGRAYIVMEHLQGEALVDRLEREGTLPWPAACAVAAQLAAAVGAAHEKGIVHRDLKPENVFLLARPGEPATIAVKVLDFGIAKLLGESMATTRTAAGSLIGTPAYMSPEQCGGSARVDHRADIYSLGCMLFEMICGAPPFVRARTRELLAAHMFAPPPSLADRQPQCPPWLDRLIARMLSKEAADRPQSMREVAQALEGGGGATAPAAPAPRARRPVPRRAVTWVAAAAVTLLLAAGAVALSARRSAPERDLAGRNAGTPPITAAARQPIIAADPLPAPRAPAGAARPAAGPAEEPAVAPSVPRRPRPRGPRRPAAPPPVEMDGIVDL